MNTSYITANPTDADWAEAIARRVCDEPLSHIRAALGDDLCAHNAITRACIAAGVTELRDSVALVHCDNYAQVLDNMAHFLELHPSLMDALIGTYAIEETYFSE